jgi:uncharacterized protein DUF3300
MKTKSRVCVSALAFALACALIASGELWAQQPAAAPAAPNPIDQLTAPIALYPDALVIQILTASKSADKLTSFAAWLKKNDKLKGSELQDAAQKAGFDAALIALAPFPQVVQMMVEKPDWTKALGQAVTADKKGVSDSIQRLRAQAKAAGNLKTTEQQTVETQTTSAGQQVIVIQPANPQVIYVPTYNPQVVYVQSAPPPSSSSAAGAALVGFTVGVLVGANNSYYHHSDNYWEAREDYYEDRADDARDNQDQRQSDRQGNQDQRQSDRQANQDQRQSTAQANQGQRQPGTPSAQSQAAASPSQRQSAGPTSTWGGGPAASRSSGMSSGGGSSYQSGSATRAQSSRGSASMSSSRGGGRSGGGRR